MSSARFLSSASVSSWPRAARKKAGRAFWSRALSATSAGISLRWRAASSMNASFFAPGQAEKGGEPLKCFDIAQRRVDATLDFAPIARVQASLFAEVAQNRLCAQKRSAEAFI